MPGWFFDIGLLGMSEKAEVRMLLWLAAVGFRVRIARSVRHYAGGDGVASGGNSGISDISGEKITSVVPQKLRE